MAVTGGNGGDPAVAYRKVGRRRRRSCGGGRWAGGGVAAENGGPAAELRRTAAARVFHARAEANLREARAASSGLQLRRGWCLRLRLDERNTMMALDTRDSLRLESYDRFTKTTET